MGMILDDFGKWTFEIRSKSVILSYGDSAEPAEMAFEFDINEIDDLYDAILDAKLYIKNKCMKEMKG
jgi:hypothetical protein